MYPPHISKTYLRLATAFTGGRIRGNHNNKPHARLQIAYRKIRTPFLTSSVNLAKNLWPIAISRGIFCPERAGEGLRDATHENCSTECVTLFIIKSNNSVVRKYFSDRLVSSHRSAQIRCLQKYFEKIRFLASLSCLQKNRRHF